LTLRDRVRRLPEPKTVNDYIVLAGGPLSDPATSLVRLTGAQILVEYLVRQGVPFAAGIPGHGCWAITDALPSS